MTIVASQLVASKCLQQFLVDKDTGLPLAAGVINLYKDNNRIERKNWYYKSGEPGSYTYLTLDNPLTLNGSGAIVDPSGNEINPYYYPYSEDSSSTEELYYITVDNADGTRQFTRTGWPPEFAGTGPDTSTASKNLIVNNRFWNAGAGVGVQSGAGANYETTVTLTNETNIVLAGSKHDGYQEPDFRFKKGKAGATETVEFKRFLTTDSKFTDDVMPQFYVNSVCTSLTTNENYKFYQFPICLNIRNLEGYKATATLQAKSAGSADASKITLAIFKNLGSSEAINDLGTLQKEFTIGADWDQITWPFTFPSLDDGESIAQTRDDAYYLQIGMPLDQPYNISFALPSIYLGTNIPTENFESYDDSDAIVFSPRTGDFRSSLNYFNNFGWVGADGTTIGSRDSGSTYKTTYAWPLFKLLWENVTTLYAPILDSGGSPSTKGASAYADWIANKRITITGALGAVLIGANPKFNTNSTYTVNITTTASSGIDTSANTVTFADIGDIQTGDEVQVDTTSYGLTADLTYYAQVVSANVLAFHESIYNAVNDIDRVDITGSYSAAINLKNTDLTLTLATATSSQLESGTPILVSTTSAAPDNLNVINVYYINSRSTGAGAYKLSTSFENARDGYAVNFYDAGTGTQTIQSALGSVTGEQNHVLTVGELARHTHDYIHIDDTSAGTPAFEAAAPNMKYFNTYVTDPTGQNKAHSSMQRSYVANVFLKL